MSFDAELQALFHGLQLAAQFGSPIWIEMDAVVIVSLFQSGQLDPWHIQHILVRIWALMDHRHIRVTYILREGNRPADYMARSGVLSHILYMFDIQSAPRYFLSLVRMDQLGYPNFGFR